VRRVEPEIGLEADSIPIFAIIIRVKIRPYPSSYYYITSYL
jgi:hypothetical protein